MRCHTMRCAHTMTGWPGLRGVGLGPPDAPQGPTGGPSGPTGRLSDCTAARPHIGTHSSAARTGEGRPRPTLLQPGLRPAGRLRHQPGVAGRSPVAHALSTRAHLSWGKAALERSRTSTPPQMRGCEGRGEGVPQKGSSSKLRSKLSPASSSAAGSLATCGKRSGPSRGQHGG